MRHNINEPTKGNSTGRNSSSGVLIMLESLVVHKKLPGKTGCDKKEEKKNMNFGAFSASFQNNPDMTICTFLTSTCSLWRAQHTDTNIYQIHSAFPCFSRGYQNSALITILPTNAGSIPFNSWLRCYHIV